MTEGLDGLIAGRRARHEDQAEDGLGDDVQDTVDEHLQRPASEHTHSPSAASPQGAFSRKQTKLFHRLLHSRAHSVMLQKNFKAVATARAVTKTSFQRPSQTSRLFSTSMQPPHSSTKG